jgi:hypothetical protein
VRSAGSDILGGAILVVPEGFAGWTSSRFVRFAGGTSGLHAILVEWIAAAVILWG